MLAGATPLDALDRGAHWRDTEAPAQGGPHATLARKAPLWGEGMARGWCRPELVRRGGGGDGGARCDRLCGGGADPGLATSAPSARGASMVLAGPVGESWRPRWESLAEHAGWMNQLGSRQRQLCRWSRQRLEKCMPAKGPGRAPGLSWRRGDPGPRLVARRPELRRSCACAFPTELPNTTRRLPVPTNPDGAGWWWAAPMAARSEDLGCGRRVAPVGAPSARPHEWWKGVHGRDRPLGTPRRGLSPALPRAPGRAPVGVDGDRVAFDDSVRANVAAGTPSPPGA